MDIYLILAYFVTGAVAGTMSGLLGVGGGIVVVPALATIFLTNPNIPAGVHIKMAIGTSLAIMIVTLIAGVRAHHKRRAVNWTLVKSVLPGLFIGIIFGTILVKLLSADTLRIFLSIFLVAMGFHLLFSKTPSDIESVISGRLSLIAIRISSCIIGTLSSLLGVGGGVMWVPLFLFGGYAMHTAVGTSAACGLLAAIMATLCFIGLGIITPDQLPESTGYIYWPAFAGVAIASILFAPLGVMLAYKLSSQWLKRVFALFIFLVAGYMLVT
jgi:uncharacterized protein